jgi:transcriptional regulator with GAF, ATPase, and Fis domain
MAKIHLRDICDHLSAAAEVEGIIDALLAYLRAYQGDWHPTLALVDGQHDAVTRIFQRERGRLDHRDVVVPVEHLPARLVRKFFRPSAFFNAGERRSLLTKVFRVTPVYEPDRFEVPQIQPLVAPVPWHSCIVLPLADQDDLLALLLLVSPRKNAFPAAAVEEVLAMRTMAALALARRLHAEGRLTPEVRIAEEQSRRSQGMFQERLRQLESETGALAQDNRLKAERMELLARELEGTQLTAHRERVELDQLRLQVHSLEEQSSVAAQHLQDSYSQLAAAQHRLNEQHETMEFLREVFEASQEAYDEALMSRALVQRFCEAFEVDRCSLMRVDDQNLKIAAHRGMDPGVAGRVNVPFGEGVAGWVASHRKPVLMRKQGDASPVRPTGTDRYNSDSFVSVPLIHQSRLLGVLNLSNKRNGKPFDEIDLDRAMMASAVLSMAMGARSSHTPVSLEQRELPPFEMHG